MSVGRICVRKVDVADAGESVQAAAGRMHARNVGTLLILIGWVALQVWVLPRLGVPT